MYTVPTGLTNEYGLQWATIKAKQTRFLFGLSNWQLFPCDCIYYFACPTEQLKDRKFLLFIQVPKCQGRAGVVEKNKVKMGKSQGDVQPPRKGHQRPTFSNHPLTFHYLPIMPPNYDSIRPLIHSLIPVTGHWQLPHRQPGSAFFKSPQQFSIKRA